MAALTKGRTTPQRVGDVRSGPAAANAVFHQGGIVMRDASGNLVQGQTATGLVGVGMGVAPVDNTGGIAGAISGRALYDGAIDLAQALAALKT